MNDDRREAARRCRGSPRVRFACELNWTGIFRRRIPTEKSNRFLQDRSALASLGGSAGQRMIGGVFEDVTRTAGEGSVSSLSNRRGVQPRYGIASGGFGPTA